ncbi:MAG: hypothetical protein JGK01_19890 [Microcoleus sp. PH2017_03_ELD_O_A]|uniref:hypothetical protein n=1 Tax=unclassified Microcoleus TaxID=2642155 RepID=UPI001DE3A1C1|nr:MULTISPECIES: hypothetical protein [unclassified Microcoleus]MCC3443941.1 hypothetical protein [Microcoleus sp. PH2017_03_ELD_O_A]MCC3504128.1 hypothetical protein [Microcoleus sp. PH2017_19_SFW_U_A]MCC3522301.1 hypothetical protein [Microcoleus sp. PH2017_20_SFW_D_A]MCC3553250.1 hypothetical protein [Microcoleus sp. PH2017_35_SFW_U_B]
MNSFYKYRGGRWAIALFDKLGCKGDRLVVIFKLKGDRSIIKKCDASQPICLRRIAPFIRLKPVESGFNPSINRSGFHPPSLFPIATGYRPA